MEFKVMIQSIWTMLLLWCGVVVSCNGKLEVDPVLTISKEEVVLADEGETQEVMITSNSAWSINNPATWLELNVTSGSGNASLEITAEINNTGIARSAVLSVRSDNGQARRITVEQGYVYTIPSIYPSYNTSPKAPDASGMSSTAVELAAKMTLGWNIGNTLEAIGGENAWGNPDISRAYVEAVKNLGFNAIRLPCSWNQYSNQSTAKIDDAWMNRVKEVVQYCIDLDMYVLLNIHWDGGWLENNCTPDQKDVVNAKQRAFWEQIATAMRDFDEHLMFASANEPNVSSTEQMDVLLSYHQTFVDAVRSTGGRNTYRSLVIQGSSQYLNVSIFPTDPTPDRMMYEEHNYTPSQFTILGEDVSWGNMVYYWGEGNHSTIEPDRNPTYGEEDAHIEFFQKMKEEFIDQGIPVLMGEYGAYRRNNSANVPLDLETHHNSVDYWATFVTSQAIAHGVIPFWWDTGGALDRANLTVKDQRTIDALKTAVEE